MNLPNISNDTTPDSVLDYGYRDAAPATRSYASSKITHHHKKTQRRSSMKKWGQPRRSSIQYRDLVEYVVPGNRKVQRKNTIGFDNNVTVRCLPPALVSQVGSPEDLWFQEEDYDKMKERSLLLVDLVQRYGPSCGFDGSKKPCIRGLENLISADEKIPNQLKACNSVLCLQAVQRNNGTFDDQALAELYMMNTIGSKREAAKLAKQDEKAARSSACRSSYRGVSP